MEALQLYTLPKKKLKNCVTGERVGGGDNDSYCDSEASLDDGSCFDNLEDVDLELDGIKRDVTNQKLITWKSLS